ncbi:hypothetical protein LCGC14_2658060 [marine sediment metagenome]|uniref:Imm-5-like domain-containing protein n=1 Tax=marine sediment metagenome TaxID=412755 RepID=A0A0F8ZSX4_9ZZZZ|nr:hypothetical protein [Candidatus Scalindua sp.]
MKKQIKKLKKLDPCVEAIEWLKDQDNRQQAWNDCGRGDWMLWLLGKQSGPPEGKKRKLLVLACCECAKLSLKYVKKGEKKPLIAIETAEKWVNGEATINEVRTAYAYAYASAASAAYASAAYAGVLKECADIVIKHYPEAPKL